MSNSIPLNASSQQDGNNPAPGPRDSNGGRISCSALDNKMMDYSTMMQGTRFPTTQPYIGGPVLVGNYNGFSGSSKNGQPSQNTLPAQYLIVLWLMTNLLLWRI